MSAENVSSLRGSSESDISLESYRCVAGVGPLTRSCLFAAARDYMISGRSALGLRISQQGGCVVGNVAELFSRGSPVIRARGQAFREFHVRSRYLAIGDAGQQVRDHVEP